ncbi:hypothetical protein [uncultured Robinsoniella sp.]
MQMTGMNFKTRSRAYI